MTGDAVCQAELGDGRACWRVLHRGQPRPFSSDLQHQPGGVDSAKVRSRFMPDMLKCLEILVQGTRCPLPAPLPGLISTL